MKLVEFVDIFIVALYHQSELNGSKYYRAGEIVELYSLPYKTSWGSIIFEDYDFSTRVRSARNIGSFENQAVMLNADGVRWVEDEVGDENVATYLEQHGAKNPLEPEPPRDTVDKLSAQIAPAANRLVTLSDNHPKREEFVAELANMRAAISGSNTLDPQEKSDVVASLNAAANLVRDSRTWFAGAMQYLVFDRIKKAFEKIIEDAIRYAILASLGILVAIILAVI